MQKRSADGTWHTVEVTRVGPSSDFHFPWTFGTPGGRVFRARITGGPVNVGSASAPVTVTLPPLFALPAS